jgi:molybdate/tungstate transport system ATP-binding protein
LLTLENVSLTIGDFRLKEVSLTVAEGEYFVILGRTGSGKTLLLESIAGVHGIGGRIFLKNEEVTRKPIEARRIGFVYQDLMLFPHMNVEQNIRFSTPYRPKTAEPSRFGELVSLLHIGDLLTRDVRTLSGGEKQRVAIARALYAEPEVLLLDEPLSAVDPDSRERIMRLLKDVAKHYGVTVLHVTHNFREAASLADRMAILLEGEMIQYGETDAVLAHPKTLQAARFLGFKNIFEGVVFGQDAAYISIDPNAVTLFRHAPSAGRVYEAVLVEIGYAVDHYKLYVETEGVTLFLKMVRRTFDTLALKTGERCYVHIDEAGVLPL